MEVMIWTFLIFVAFAGAWEGKHGVGWLLAFKNRIPVFVF